MNTLDCRVADEVLKKGNQYSISKSKDKVRNSSAFLFFPLPSEEYKKRWKTTFSTMNNSFWRSHSFQNVETPLPIIRETIRDFCENPFHLRFLLKYRSFEKRTWL